MEKVKSNLKSFWEDFKKCLKKLKPVKYITLLHNYNSLETKYEALLDNIKDKCFEEIYSRITVPEQLQKKDREIARLKKKIAKLEGESKDV